MIADQRTGGKELWNISKYSKIAKYKVNMPKSFFFNISTLTIRIWNLKHNIFYNTTKKLLMYKSKKYVHNLQAENYKTLMWVLRVDQRNG